MLVPDYKTMLTPHWGLKLPGSKLACAGYVIGFENPVTGCIYRIDFSPPLKDDQKCKGLHLNENDRNGNATVPEEELIIDNMLGDKTDIKYNLERLEKAKFQLWGTMTKFVEK